MPGGPRGEHQDLAAAKLACGGTVAEAAEAAGVDVRTVFKWKAEDAGFRARIAELRAAAVSGALGRLTDGMTRAADALVALLANRSPSVRLKAARAVIELGLRVRAEVEVEERLAAVERALEGGDAGEQGAAEAGRGEGESGAGG
jgi:hypothetical protein